MNIIYNKDLPDRLQQIDQSPKRIFAYGEKELLFSEKTIAIIGSRDATEEGKKNAFEFSKELCKAGFVVVSGFALGIDTYAHQGAIAVNGKTIAVIGCGIKKDYPKKNKFLKAKLIEKHLIISEYGEDDIPNGYNFPHRNRIISGLSLGVLVVEAKIKSGSMTTVNHALNQGKPVFSVPGSISNPLSEGTNYLIKIGAIPVTEASDIIDYLMD